MKVERCDMCGKDIKPYEFDIIWHGGFKVNITVSKPPNVKNLDLCRECNEKLIDYFVHEAEQSGIYECEEPRQ